MLVGRSPGTQAPPTHQGERAVIRVTCQECLLPRLLWPYFSPDSLRIANDGRFQGSGYQIHQPVPPQSSLLASSRFLCISARPSRHSTIGHNARQLLDFNPAASQPRTQPRPQLLGMRVLCRTRAIGTGTMYYNLSSNSREQIRSGPKPSSRRLREVPVLSLTTTKQSRVDCNSPGGIAQVVAVRHRLCVPTQVAWNISEWPQKRLREICSRKQVRVQPIFKAGGSRRNPARVPVRMAALWSKPHAPTTTSRLRNEGWNSAVGGTPHLQRWSVPDTSALSIK
ncbi:hypothetical protein MAPG_07757 [Magnaporthiopsis poae ATCC 64411]|uniref:Uncharacterized protein n=1 Tax=Magnaporthiopsis poae (strain ATCC 64411 / 73-15) TaxID=644358 RepID=A0A0C4E5I8_MAGP6|nr:hypothetical protein MAPG_07757 [Magnaporthiopsis poae ATCC 64411]